MRLAAPLVVILVGTAIHFLAAAQVGSLVATVTATAASKEKPGGASGGGGTGNHDHVHEGQVPQVDAAIPQSIPGPVAWFSGGRGLFVPHYYDAFKDIDLSQLDPPARERFLHLVNTEYCTCGQQRCRRDTIANCYTNDSACPRAPVRLREILESVKKVHPMPGRNPAPPAPAPGR